MKKRLHKLIQEQFLYTTNGGSSNNVSSTNGQNHNLFRENNGVTTTVLGGINPAHGQPNHRCDIAVGAPLNSVSNSASAKLKFSNTTSKYNC
jgi:hypothetical protein